MPHPRAHPGPCERLLAAVDDPVAFQSAAVSAGLVPSRPLDVQPSPGAGALVELELSGCGCRLVHDEPDRLYDLLRRLLTSGRRVQLLRLERRRTPVLGGSAPAWSLRQLIEQKPGRLPVAVVVEIVLRAPG